MSNHKMRLNVFLLCLRLYTGCEHVMHTHTDAVLSQNGDEFFVFNFKKMKKICKEQHR